jgi:hypothetical protein
VTCDRSRGIGLEMGLALSTVPPPLSESSLRTGLATLRLILQTYCSMSHIRAAVRAQPGRRPRFSLKSRD